jgi:hypothetical protein
MEKTLAEVFAPVRFFTPFFITFSASADLRTFT